VHGVITSSGPLDAFRAWVRGDKVGAVSYEEFLAELQRDPKARSWLAGEVRDVSIGQHEWLPVSIAYEVLQRAVVAEREELRKGLGWISLLENLRSPTNAVLWKIVSDPVVLPGTTSQEGPRPEARGHVSALSLDRYTLVQDGLTVGTGEFHKALREFFLENQWMDPAAWVDALLAFLPTIMWTGSDLPIPVELRHRSIGVFYPMPSGLFVPGLTVAQVQAEQQARWEEIEAVFLRAKAAIR
jgi:hypothetical protein